MTPGGPLFLRRFPRPMLGAAVLLSLAACTIPTPGYRKVDPSTAEFREAVAREAERLTARGQSYDNALESATRTVTSRLAQTQKVERREQVLPLTRAVEALEQPRGCWAYTVTTTTRKVDGTTVLVERFDAFQPEAQLWTLVSRDGKAPDENEQATYRERKLRQWKIRATRRRPSYLNPDRFQRDAIFRDFTLTPLGDGRTDEFVFAQGKVSIPLLGTLTGQRNTYHLERASGALQRVVHWTGPDSIALGMKAVHYETSTDFAVLEPNLPPFPTRTLARFRFIVAGKDTGDVEREIVHSDYRRVKCFDDRFEVRIGVPEMQDFMPDRE